MLESRVESGRVDLHPIKRARTTFTYLAVATMGSDEQKRAIRRAVDRVQAYSTDESPVKYHAFDKDLQLWVGACLYKGGVDVYRLFVGEMDQELRIATTAMASRRAPRSRCPRTCGPRPARRSTGTGRESLQKVHIDDAVREYLWPIAAGRIRSVTAPTRVRGV